MDVRALRRRLATVLPEARQVRAGESMLERSALASDAPRLVGATLVEGEDMRAYRLPAGAEAAFRGFLDGTQRSEVVAHIGAAAIIVGHVGAVVRERRRQRMQTWRAPLREARLYAPRVLLGDAAWDALNSLDTLSGGLVVDTSPDVTASGAHPYALRDAAIHLVQAHRESLEQRLAEAWCASEGDPLYVDGGISGSDAVAVSAHTVGVIKSHRTLYAEGPALDVVLGLSHRQRSSVFRVTSRRRTAVASWYLRLRDNADHDPMWGLVRVEVADTNAAPALESRADLVSRWILAEASPLALPDARWDTMVYGIRDCEEFLRAVT